MSFSQVVRRNKILVFLFLVFASVSASAQAPANDSCHNAEVLYVGTNGYGFGTFLTDSVALDSATIQVGEYFHSSLVTSGNDKKSIWFKFYLSARRGVDLELKQNSNNIATKDCGFTTYYANQCLPTSTMATAAKLTTLNQFGSSFHPCMEPGWYMVQVSAKARAKGKIYLQIKTTYPHEYPAVVNAEYDARDSAFYFGDQIVGKRGSQSGTASYEMGCYTIKDSTELFADIGVNYRAYNQSAWFVFKANDKHDNTQFAFGGSGCTSYDTMAYRLFRGDARGGGSLQLLDSGYSDWRAGNTCYGNCSNIVRNYKCLFDSGVTYSVQLLYHEDLDNTMSFRIYDQTAFHDSTQVKPVSGIARDVGIITGTKTFYYGFSCESYINPNSCGNANQPISTGTYNFTYNLSQWFTFELDEQSRLTTNVSYGNTGNYKNYSYLAFRLFRDTVTSNCNDVDTTNLITTWYGTNGFTLDCLEPGKYTIQVLGTDTFWDYSNIRCNNGSMHLGGDYSLTFRQYKLPSQNRFALSAVGAGDTINNFSDLPKYTTINGQYDTVSCFDGPSPDSVCDRNKKKVMYRTFVVGDADNDGTADSGLLRITGLTTYRRPWPYYTYHTDHQLFKGNAIDLRNSQNVYNSQDTLKGLIPYRKCLGPTISHFDACVEPGTYTLVSYFDSIAITQVERPSFYVATHRDTFNTYAKAGFIDSITNYGTVYSAIDTLSCSTNPDTIDGVYCGRRNRYHVFYLDTTSVLSVSLNYYGYAYLGARISVFEGDIRNGKSGLKLYNSNGRNWNCNTSFASTDCRPSSPGWYTILVSNDYNIQYDDTLLQGNGYQGYYLYNYPYRISISTRATTVNPPKYYRPSLAAYVDSMVNNNQPLSYDTNYSTTPGMPQHMARFQFPTEVLECDLDTPINHFPKSQLCDTNITDIVYYTFNLDKDAYVKIYGQCSGGTWKANLFDFDVRKDSAKLATATPVQQCNANANLVEFCNLLKGTYSVVYYCKRTSGTRASVSPIMHIDTVVGSRFDFAKNAYDFGEIPGDSMYYAGKIGDVHPWDTSLAPSHDRIGCRTGSWVTDPSRSGACYINYNPHVYAGDTNVAMFPNDSTYTRVLGNNYSYYSGGGIRRNLWYTFVINGAGKVTVKLNTIAEKYLTSTGNCFRFSIFESDEDGNLSFANLVASGKLDSTESDGLEYITRDYYYCWSNSSYTAQFENDICDTIKKRRYYVVVDANNAYNNSSIPNVNQHLWLEVKYDTNLFVVPNSKFDHYSDANEINGLNDVDLLINGGFNTSTGWDNSNTYWLYNRSDVTPVEGGHLWAYYRGYQYTDTARLSQDVNLAAYQSIINAGNATANFDGYIQVKNETTPDKGRIKIIYYNSSGGVISTYNSGWESPQGYWKKISDSRTIPSGAVKLRVEIEALYASSNYYNDVYFDEFSLFIQVPSTSKASSALASETFYQGNLTYLKTLSLDTTDYNRTYYYRSCSDPSIAGTAWYKIKVDSTGYIFYNMRYTDYSAYGDYRTLYTYSDQWIRLYRSTIDGDSINGLEYVPYIGGASSYTYPYLTKMGSNPVYACVSPGTYYIQINKCDWGSCNDHVVPQVMFDFHDGDLCETAIPLQIDSLQKVVGRTLVNCHTIGTDFGEDGTNMGCLYGPKDYKSSWFKVDYTDTTKVDLEFKLGEYTTAKAGDIRYRAYYGNCISLTPGPCNNNALTSFVLDCIRKGTYYIQIVTPSDATGELEMSVEAMKNTDTTCNPVDIFQPNAAFYYNTKCPENVVEFINTSSRGDSIRYFWDFGYNGLTDTVINPVVPYPPLNVETTYTVSLVVEHITRGSKDSISIDVVVPYSPYANIFNTDTMLCVGDSVKLIAEISNWKGVWSTGDTTDSITVKTTGMYYYDMLDKKQLIENPSFQRDPTTNGWTSTAGTWTRTGSYGPRDSSYAGFATHSAYNATGVLELYQDVDVSYDSMEIDSGIAKTSLTGYIRGHNSYLDEGQIILQYLDKNGNLLGIYQSGMQNYNDNWQYVEHSRTTPKKTRKLRIVLQTNKINESTATSYIFFDFFKLKMRSACSYMDSVYVQINPLPEVNLPEDTFFCVNDSFLLHPEYTYHNPYLIQDSMKLTTSGRVYNSATHSSINKYVSLTPNNVLSSNGQIEWVDSSLLLTDSFTISFDYYSPGYNVYALWFYMFNHSTPTNEDYTGGGYSIAFDSDNVIQLEWNNSRRYNGYPGIDLDYGGWRNVKIKYANQRFEIYIDGVLYTTFTDATTRSQAGYKFGVGARSYYYGDFRVKNFQISKDNDAMVVVPKQSQIAYNYQWNDAYADSTRWVNQTSTFTLKVTDHNGCVSNEDTTTITEVKQYDSLFLTPENVCSELDSFQLTKPVATGYFYGNSDVDSSGLVLTANVPFGNNTIYFSVIDTFGCLNLDTSYFILDSVPQIQIDSTPHLCRNDSIYVLTVNNNDGYFYGGTYVDSSGNFDPSKTTQNYSRVYYRTAGDDCVGMDSIDILVDSIPSAAIFSAGPFCENAGVQRLQGLVNTNGSFQVSTYLDSIGDFDPGIATAGTYSVYYTVEDGNGCSNTDSTVIVVDSIPDASIASAGPFCENAGVQKLDGQVNTGGRFTSTSYLDTVGYFNPAIAQSGSHLVFYQFTDGKGCSNSDSAVIVVDSIPSTVFTSNQPYCENGVNDTLVPVVNSGGYFYGHGNLDSNGVFNPVLAGKGQHKLFYTFTDGNGCTSIDSNVVTVDTITPVQVTHGSPYCIDDTVQRIVVSPDLGGNFSGGNYIDTAGWLNLLTAGVGTHPIYFQQANGFGCITYDTTSVYVDSLPIASIQTVQSYCANDDSVKINPELTGGYFNGGSYVDSTGWFYPKVAGAGNHKVYYNIYNSSGCFARDSVTITVDSIPDASIASAGPFCENAGIQQLIGSVNTTGTFVASSYLDTTGKFDPSIATTGNHLVYYQFTDGNGCSNMDSLSIVVDSIPDASIVPAGPFCENGGIDTIKPAVNTGGIFTETSYLDSTGLFDPAIAKVGSHKVYYTFVDGKGCSNTDSTVVVIDSIPDASIAAAGPYCANDTIQRLTGAVNTSGWFTKTNYIDSLGNFDPFQATAGLHRIYYSFKDGNGCSNTDSANIQVDTIPDASIVAAGPFCENGGIANLQPNINSGGKFTVSSYLDSAGRFDPSIAKSGSHRVYYTFTDGNGCVNTDSSSIQVDTIPDASIVAAGPFCANDTIQTLQPKSNANGLFIATSYIDTSGNFDPFVAQAGSHKVYYTFTDGNSCSNMDSTVIVVDSIPNAAITAAGPFCENGGVQTITPAVNSGGKFFETTYLDSSGKFDPSVAMAGNFKIYYTFVDGNGCSNTDSANIQVDSIPSAQIVAAGPFCLNSGIQKLVPQYNVGGKFGPITYIDSIGNFDPLKANKGLHKVFYTFTDGNGCVGYDSTTIAVDSLPDASIQDPGNICLNEDSVILMPTYAGGKFSGGLYIDTNGVFKPSISGLGNFQIYYTLDDGNGCSNTDSITLRVDSIPNAAISPSGPFCENAGVQRLLPLVNANGRFIPLAFIDTLGDFDPSVAASGTHTVYYQFVDGNGCSNTDSIDVQVDSIPDASIVPAGPFCENADEQQIVHAINNGGKFTSTAFIDTAGLFDPGVATSGQHKLYYTFIDGNGCGNTDSTIVQVDTIPDASITPAGPFCENAGPQTLVPNYSTSGKFTSSSFIDTAGEFFPAAALAGSHKVFYNAIDGNGCMNTDSITVVVDSIPDASLPNAGPYCENAGDQMIVPLVNASGSFTVTSYLTASGNFSPDVAKAGSHKIFYNLTDGNGCSSSDSIIIQVDTIPDATFSVNGPYCLNDDPVVFLPLVNTGGVFSGAVTTSSGDFDPASIGAGTHKVKYEFVDGSGCVASDSQDVVVYGLPDASLPIVGAFCNNAMPFQINPTTSGGTFSGGGYISSTGLFSFRDAPAGLNKVVYTITNSNNCTASDSFDMEVLAIPEVNIYLEPDKGCEPLDVILTTDSFGYQDSLVWLVNNIAYPDLYDFTLTFPAGIHSVALIVYDTNGCSNSADTMIEAFAKPVANFDYSPDKIYISDPEVFFNDLSTGSVVGWDWEFGDGGVDNIKNPSHLYPGAGEYEVILYVENGRGCLDTTRQTVIVLDELLVFIPNAISPNEDGLNDVFRVTGIGYTNISIQIFNRWGERIYESDDFTQWDGTYQGEKVQLGSYMYIMTIIDNRGRKQFMKGEVTVVR